MTVYEFSALIDELESDLQSLWESALASRDAANEVLGKRTALAMKMTKMRLDALQGELNEKEEDESHKVTITKRSR